MSPHGGPDWGNRAKADVVFGVQDLGELAARLGAISTFHRAGKVVWQDGFEDGINHWIAQVTGEGGALTWVPTHSRNGATSLRITTGPTTGALVGALAWHPYQQLSKLGFEFSFMTLSSVMQASALLDLFNGSKHYQAGVLYNYATDGIYYLDSTGAWVAVSTVAPIRVVEGLFNTLKLIIDLPNEKYKSVFLNHLSWSLSSYNLFQETDTTAPGSGLTLQGQSPAAASQDLYLDDIIFTQEEP